MNVLRVLSLFSGCGGMDLGIEGGFSIPKCSLNKNINADWIENDINQNYYLLKKNPFETVFANDIRPMAKTLWCNYFKNLYNEKKINDLYHIESIVDLVKQHNRGNDVFPKNIDIVTGGFPCQDFSVAGKRKGFKSSKGHNENKIDDYENPEIENRGMLYYWMREVIRFTTPKMFIAENVKGLVSLTNAKEIIEKDFKSIGEKGFTVIPAQIINVADFGVSQNRERVIFFGFNNEFLNDAASIELNKSNIVRKFDPYPDTTHCDKYLNNGSPYLADHVPLKSILHEFKEPEEETADFSQMTYSKARFYGKHVQGQTEINLESISPTIRAEHHGNIEFRRLSFENSGKNIVELNLGLKQRRLTVRECAQIQTFPRDYEFVIKKGVNRLGVSGSEAYRLIGNAVPPFFAYHLARNIMSKWKSYFGEGNDYF